MYISFLLPSHNFQNWPITVVMRRQFIQSSVIVLQPWTSFRQQFKQQIIRPYSCVRTTSFQPDIYYTQQNTTEHRKPMYWLEVDLPMTMIGTEKDFISDLMLAMLTGSVAMQRRQYGNSPDSAADYNTRAGRGSAGGVVRYYQGQSKCFDAGDLAENTKENNLPLAWSRMWYIPSKVRDWLITFNGN
uniref:Uncharacterized protein n=1 Tax=Ditylenchus dipsaci TaxID=166011 RepID=A0A915D879_9BILA